MTIIILAVLGVESQRLEIFDELELFHFWLVTVSTLTSLLLPLLAFALKFLQSIRFFTAVKTRKLDDWLRRQELIFVGFLIFKYLIMNPFYLESFLLLFLAQVNNIFVKLWFLTKFLVFFGQSHFRSHRFHLIR